MKLKRDNNMISVYINKTTRCLLLIGSLVFIFLLTGCLSEEKIATENIMTKGDRIVAITDSGELTITAGQGNKRCITVSGKENFLKASYTWLGDTVCVQLTERKTRYRGSLGLYCDTNVKKIRKKNIKISIKATIRIYTTL